MSKASSKGSKGKASPGGGIFAHGRYETSSETESYPYVAMSMSILGIYTQQLVCLFLFLSWIPPSCCNRQIPISGVGNRGATVAMVGVVSAIKVHYPQVTIAPDIASEETKGLGKKRKRRHQAGCRAALSHHVSAWSARARKVKMFFMLHPSCLVKCQKSKQRVLLLDKPSLKEKHFLPFSFLP